jgi:hypothetical protein
MNLFSATTAGSIGLLAPRGSGPVAWADGWRTLGFGTGWAIEVDDGLGRSSLSFRPTSERAALAVRANKRSRFWLAVAPDKHFTHCLQCAHRDTARAPYWCRPHSLNFSLTAGDKPRGASFFAAPAHRRRIQCYRLHLGQDGLRRQICPTAALMFKPHEQGHPEGRRPRIHRRADMLASASVRSWY